MVSGLHPSIAGTFNSAAGFVLRPFPLARKTRGKRFLDPWSLVAPYFSLLLTFWALRLLIGYFRRVIPFPLGKGYLRSGLGSG